MNDGSGNDQLETRVDYLEREVAELHGELRELREEFATIRRAIMRRFGQLDRVQEELESRLSPASARPSRGSGERAGESVDRAGESRETPGEFGELASESGETADEMEFPSHAVETASRPAAREEAAPGGPDAVAQLEDWIGRNALLAVGLLALVAGAGFLLKHAFEQGWISPGIRVTAGVLVGLVVAAGGEMLQQRGQLRYGSALVAGGAAIAYLAVWAAAGPYGLVSGWVGITGLVTLTVLVFLSAASSGVELLAGLAAAGAFLAPLILPSVGGGAGVLMAYCASVAVASGSVAAMRGWTRAFGVVLAGYFLLPLAAGAADMGPLTGALYLAGGGAAALWITDRRRWHWLYRAAFLVAWPVAAAHVAGSGETTAAGSWVGVMALALMTVPTFRRTLRLSLQGEDGPGRGAPVALGAAALLLTGAVLEVLPPPLGPVPLVAAGTIAVPFLWEGNRHRLPLFHAIGFTVLAWGCADQLDPLAATGAWVALAVGSAALTRDGEWARARWTGFALLALATLALFTVQLEARPAAEPILVGAWSWTMYAVVGGFVVAGGPLWGNEPGPAERSYTEFGGGLTLRGLFFAGVVIVLAAGGTAEITHYFGPPVAAGEEGARLARDLGVSAWWLALAGALLGAGLWMDRRPLRLAGLSASGLALAKVVLYDLIRLDALYRVASLVLLAVVLLLGAWAYSRRDSRSSGGTGSPST